MGTLLRAGDLRDCPLAYGDNDEHKCAWCGKPLVGRQRRWCCYEHGSEWARQHCWTNARDAAKKRAESNCTRCGAHDAVGDDGRWRSARLEVNHVSPVLGKHSQNGCHHHLDGLETLCHDCHVKETARQFGYRTAVNVDQLDLGASA